MGGKKRVSSPPQGGAEAGAVGHLLLTSSIGEVDGRRAVVLLAAQPDPQHPAEYLLEATVVPERPLDQKLRMVLEWQGGRRTAVVGNGSQARWRGIPAAALQALQAGDQQALVLRLEKATDEGDALG